MKKTILFSLVVMIALSSCKTNFSIVPKAVNTINAVSLNELNLEHKDYKILKNVSGDAVVIYHQKNDKSFTIKEQNGEFELNYEQDKFGNWKVASFKGIARYGFLSNDYGKVMSVNDMNLEYVARNVAIYRLINACKIAGGDGVIEPTISMSVGEGGRKEIVLSVNATAKVIKLNTDK